MNNNKKESLSKVVINWYPGHMEKTKRQIKEKLPLIDFVLELIDARIPFSSKVVDIDNIVKSKLRILVLTKKDLADTKELNKWISYYQKSYEYVIAVDLKENSDYKKLLNIIDEVNTNLNKTRESKGLKPKESRGLVIGIPNVGKSTLINKLASKKVAGVGNKPGFTKSLTWLKAKNVLLLDSPGILWPKFDNDEIALNLASMSAIKEEVLQIDDVAVHILKKLNSYYKNILEERYGIKELNEDFVENYQIISNKYNIAKINQELDYNKISLMIVNDMKNERIKGICFDRVKDEK